MGLVNWHIYIVDGISTFYANAITLNILIGIVAFVVAVTVVWLLKGFLRPILSPVSEATELIQTSLLDDQTHLSSSDDPVVLTSAVRRVATRIDRLSTELDRQVKRHNRDLQVAGLIGRETVTLSDLDALAKRSINLICNELGFYHAQIFLLDASRTQAQLRYSRGEAGDKLIEQGHQLRVGSDSIIGQTTATKKR